MKIRALAVTLGLLILAPVGAWSQEPAKTRIVAFGDSITEGFGQTPYSVYLQQSLNTSECNSVVINEGLRGEISFDGASRIDSVLSKHNPQYIIIMEGANDARSGVSPQITAAALATMMDKAVSAGATPIVGAVTPNTELGQEDPRIPEEFNPAIQQEARSRGVTFVDTYTPLTGTNWGVYNIDGLHLSDQGQSIIANEFFKAIPCGSSSGGGGGGCFIATAAFGSVLEPQVELLRQFRDVYLLTNGPGRLFVDFYYTYSPALAEKISESELLKFMVRVALLPLLGIAYLLLNGLWYVLAGLLLIPGLIFVRKTQIAGAFRG